jgi:RNA polymerase sigma-70 factor (ECF subfamily)
MLRLHPKQRFDASSIHAANRSLIRGSVDLTPLPALMASSSTFSTFGNGTVSADKYLSMGGQNTPEPGAAVSIVDPMAFERGFEENFSLIHRFVARRVGTALADDLAAETFAIAFRRRASFDPKRGSLRSWLYGIATNLVRNHWRTEQSLLKLATRLRVGSEYLDDLSISDERLSASLVAPRIAAALASLNEEQRDVILLHAWAELKHDEIAHALGIAPGTVRSRLSRARAVMANQLGSFDFDLWLFDEDQRPHALERTDHD